MKYSVLILLLATWACGSDDAPSADVDLGAASGGEGGQGMGGQGSQLQTCDQACATAAAEEILQQQMANCQRLEDCELLNGCGFDSVAQIAETFTDRPTELVTACSDAGNAVTACMGATDCDSFDEACDAEFAASNAACQAAAQYCDPALCTDACRAMMAEWDFDSMTHCVQSRTCDGFEPEGGCASEGFGESVRCTFQSRSDEVLRACAPAMRALNECSLRLVQVTCEHWDNNSWEGCQAEYDVFWESCSLVLP